MIYLAGDSVFDNASYTSPSLIQQMGAGARLLARDGAVVATLLSQLAGVEPTDGDVLVVSVGGNDAMGSMGLVTGVSPAVATLAEIGDEADTFEDAYSELLAAARRAGWERVIACTIYNGNFERHSAAIAAGVRLFDDAIQSCATFHGVALLELRDIFVEPEDFANAIEPSFVGGAKLATAIREMAALT